MITHSSPIINNKIQNNMCSKKSIFLSLLFISHICWAQSDKAIELYKQGKNQNKIGKLINASVLFTEAIAEFPDYAQAYYYRGVSFKGIGKINQAVKDFNKAVNLSINNVNPYLELIHFYKNTQQYITALIITNKLIIAMPENAAGAYYDQGKIYEEIGEEEKAVHAYYESIKFLDDNAKDFKQKLIQRINELQESNHER